MSTTRTSWVIQATKLTAQQPFQSTVIAVRLTRHPEGSRTVAVSIYARINSLFVPSSPKTKPTTPEQYANQFPPCSDTLRQEQSATHRSTPRSEPMTRACGRRHEQQPGMQPIRQARTYALCQLNPSHIPHDPPTFPDPCHYPLG